MKCKHCDREAYVVSEYDEKLCLDCWAVVTGKAKVPVGYRKIVG